MLSKKSFLIDRRIFSGRWRSRAATLGTISFHTKTTTDRAIGPTEPCSSENIEDSTFARFSEFFDFRLFRLHRSKPLTGGNPAARPRLPNAQLTATDLNPPMVEVARTKFQSSEKVHLRSADAMALPFPDGAFDAVVCQFGVMFFPDKAKSYQEVNRVLTPVGAICSTSGICTATIRSAGSLMKLQVASSPLTSSVLQRTVHLSSDRPNKAILDRRRLQRPPDCSRQVVKEDPKRGVVRARLGLWQSANRPNPRARWC